MQISYKNPFMNRWESLEMCPGLGRISGFIPIDNVSQVWTHFFESTL